MEENISLKSSLLFSSLTPLKFTASEKNGNQRVRGGVNQANLLGLKTNFIHKVSYRTCNIMLFWTTEKTVLKIRKKVNTKEHSPDASHNEIRLLSHFLHLPTSEAALCGNMTVMWGEEKNSHLPARVKSHNSSNTTMQLTNSVKYL